MTNPKDVIAEMQSQVTKHLVLCCQELDEYRLTGILKEGKVRELARSVQKVARNDSLQVVTSQVTSVAIQRVSQWKEKK